MKRDKLRIVMLVYQVLTVGLLIAFILISNHRYELFLSWWIVTALLILCLLIELIRLMWLRMKIQKLKDDIEDNK